MSDDRFRAWEFRTESEEDTRIRAEFGLGPDAKGAGAADPSSIDFRWHQHNLEDAVTALRESRASLVSGQEARRSVALIEAIYKSAANGGSKVEVG